MAAECGRGMSVVLSAGRVVVVVDATASRLLPFA
jgi:hypothetical protein